MGRLGKKEKIFLTLERHMIRLKPQGGIFKIGAAALAVLVAIILSTSAVFGCHITAIKVSQQSGSLTYGTPGSATFTIIGVSAYERGEHVVLRVVDLPPGTVSSWDQPEGKYLVGKTSTSAVLTVTTTGSSLQGSYPFKVTAQDSEDLYNQYIGSAISSYLKTRICSLSRFF
jgi:hypothetical protein